MIFGMKHSLCFTSIVSKAQPSLSMPIKNSLHFWNLRKRRWGSLDSTLAFSFPDSRLPCSEQDYFPSSRERPEHRKRESRAQPFWYLHPSFQRIPSFTRSSI